MKTLKVIGLLLITVCLFNCEHTKKEESKPITTNETMEKPKNLAGGWSDAEVTDEVKKAAEFAVSALNPSAKISNISAAKTQIVSGKNYEVHFTLDNGEDWKVVVYRNLKNEYQLTSSEKLN